MEGFESELDYSFWAKGGGKILTCGFLSTESVCVRRGKGIGSDFLSSFRERKSIFLLQKLYEAFLLVFSSFKIF